MATKASDQITIVDLTDGYSVNLTNDSYTFAGDKNGKVASQQSTTTVIQALRGSEVPTISVDTQVPAWQREGLLQFRFFWTDL